MNLKITDILPLAIVLFVSDVYCPPTPENMKAFTSWYRLRKCKSNSVHLDFNGPDSIYDVYCSEEDPFHCDLIERSSHKVKTHTLTFKRANVEFISMKDEELTFIMYPYPTDVVKWGVTCEFLSVEQAQKFYKFITQNRHSELMHLLEADYVKESDDNMLAKQPNVFLDGFERNITVVVKNYKGDAVLIFPKDAISEVNRSGTTEMSVYISMNRGPRVLYKFGFETHSQTTAMIRLMNKLKQYIEGSYAENYRRPLRDPAVDSFFTQTKLDLPF